MLIMRNFIDRLHQYMREKNLSQKELSELVGCSKSYISMLLSKKKVPSTKFIEQLSNATNTTPQWWIYNHESKNDCFYALSDLVDMLIEKDLIHDDATMTERAKEMIDAMLKAEIEKKIKSIKEKENQNN